MAKFTWLLSGCDRLNELRDECELLIPIAQRHTDGLRRSACVR